MTEHRTIIFLGFFVMFCLQSLPAILQDDKQEELLSKDSNPLIWSLAESLQNRQLAQDTDLGQLDISDNPRTVVVRNFLQSFMHGKIEEELIVAQAREALYMYLRSLYDQGLRYTSFRIGIPHPKIQEMFIFHIKLMGYSQKTLASVIVQQNEDTWKILAFSLDPKP